MHELSTWIPVSEETLIDAGLGTPEMIERDEARRAESRARWLALPPWVRWHRVAQSRWWDFRYRLARAVRAYRGEDME